MQINNFKYVLDMETGNLYMILSENEIFKTNYYNDGTVRIATDKDDNIVSIMINGFAKYCINEIMNCAFKKLIK